MKMHDSAAVSISLAGFPDLTLPIGNAPIPGTFCLLTPFNALGRFVLFYCEYFVYNKACSIFHFLLVRLEIII